MLIADNFDSSIKTTLQRVMVHASWTNHLRRIMELDGEFPIDSASGLKRGQQIEHASSFKVKLIDSSIWAVCKALPAEPIFDEWIYFDDKGVPSMFWSASTGEVVLI